MTISSILNGLPLVLFWGAVLAFIPATFYLLIKNPSITRNERFRSRGIFILGQDHELQKQKSSRLRTVGMIYMTCCLSLLVVYIVNAGTGNAGLQPFDIFSSLSIVVFWFAVISYLPVAFYLIWKNPWRKEEDGLCLNWVFTSYGLAIFSFALFFIAWWLAEKNIPIAIKDVLESLFIVLLSAFFIAYIPVLIYICYRLVCRDSSRGLHFNVVFIIYALCFIVFACLYGVQWVRDQRVGDQDVPLSVYFEL
ncbi:MAG: hypothetical protein ACLFPX_07550 [Candidatus Omnitrophota bacterium]